MVEKLQFKEKYLYINEKQPIGRAGFILCREVVKGLCLCEVAFQVTNMTKRCCKWLLINMVIFYK